MDRTTASLVALALVAAPAASATTLFTNEADFLAAAGAVVIDDFETSGFDGVTIDFTAGTITCSGGNFCTTFYGNEFGGGLARSGTKAPYFGTPDTLTFSFSAPVTAFGVFIGGSGDVGSQTLNFALSNGDMFEPFPGYANGSGTFVGNTLFVGFVSPVPFDTLAITGSLFGDGVFLDDLYLSTADVVPQPSSLALIGLGLMGLAVGRRR